MFRMCVCGFKVFLLACYVLIMGCSRDLDSMSMEERAIFQPNRYASDNKQDAYHKALDMLRFMDIKQGDVIVDLQGGDGYFSELFNYMVGDSGRVIIVNTSHFLHYFSKDLKKRLNKQRLKNVVRVDSEYSNLKLPSNADILFISQGYHNIYVPRKDPVDETTKGEFLLQLSKALKKGGKLVIIEHAAKPGTGISTTAKLHRIDEKRVRDDMTEFGFKYIKSLDVLRNAEDNYGVDIWNKQVIRNTDRFIHMYVKK